LIAAWLCPGGVGGAALADPQPVAPARVEPAPLEASAVRCGGGGRAAPGSWADGSDDGVACRPIRVACPCDDPCLARRRGPIEVRDGYLLAQPLLTLAAVSPDTLGCGTTSIRVQGVWSNTFGWRQNESGENPARRYFLADGESRTGVLSVAHGFTPDLDLGARLAVHWRGGGVSDDWIDAFHEFFANIGFTDNKRSDFRTDAFRINGRRTDGGTFNADADSGTGLGNLEIFGKWRFADGGRDGWSWALVGRATAPTGSHPFDPSGIEGALQVVGARRLARDWDVYGGIGAIGRTETRFQGMEFSPVVGHVFAAAEFRLGSRWSLLAETDYATNLANGIERHDPDRWYLDIGAKVDLDARTTFEMGFVENLISQQTTLDIGIHLGVEFRF
jgi:hypothetical protein